MRVTGADWSEKGEVVMMSELDEAIDRCVGEPKFCNEFEIAEKELLRNWGIVMNFDESVVEVLPVVWELGTEAEEWESNEREPN